MKQRNQWRPRPILGILLSAAAVIIPLGVSVVVAVAVGRLLPRSGSVLDHVEWWAAVLASSTVAFIGFERLCRRFLPLAALLKMTMLFPDQAPKRLRVAWRSGSVRNLERNAEGGISSVPSEAAGDILALAASLSRHDRATRGHSERVRALTDMIANELHLPAESRDRLRWSALLHDVGKLSVHPHVLNKPERLTDEEWAEIRNHPLEGRRLTAPLAPWLGEWGLVIEQHHESYDGSGYPFGLSGQQISLGARIVTVADSFEVMTAVRSYKKAMGAVAARKELTRCAGTQFDPAIVRAFLNISLGRLRWTISPISWLADIPFVARLGVIANGAATAGQAALVAGALAAGGALALHATPTHTPSSATSNPTHAATSTSGHGSDVTTPSSSRDATHRSQHRSSRDRGNGRAGSGHTSSTITHGSTGKSTSDPTRSQGSGAPSHKSKTGTAPAGGTGTSTTTPGDVTTTTTASSSGTTTTTNPSATTTTRPPTTSTTSTTTTTQPPPTTSTTSTTTTTQPPPTTTTTPKKLCILVVCL
jgi:HD-GYP domain-containing protein (c-di-GMP phosphodiesterase class II)